MNLKLCRTIRHAQNRGEAPSPSFAPLTRPLPARRGEVKLNTGIDPPSTAPRLAPDTRCLRSSNFACPSHSRYCTLFLFSQFKVQYKETLRVMGAKHVHDYNQSRI